MQQGHRRCDCLVRLARGIPAPKQQPVSPFTSGRFYQRPLLPAPRIAIPVPVIPRPPVRVIRRVRPIRITVRGIAISVAAAIRMPSTTVSSAAAKHHNQKQEEKHSGLAAEVRHATSAQLHSTPVHEGTCNPPSSPVLCPFESCHSAAQRRDLLLPTLRPSLPGRSRFPVTTPRESLDIPDKMEIGGRYTNQATYIGSPDAVWFLMISCKGFVFLILR